MVCKQSQQWQQYVVWLPEWLWTYLLAHRRDLLLTLRYMGSFNGNFKTCGCVKPTCVGMSKHCHIPVIDIEHSLLSPTEEEMFFTLNGAKGDLRAVPPHHQSNCLCTRNTYCLGTHKSAWPQFPNAAPILPDLFWLSQWIQTSNLCDYFVAVVVVVVEEFSSKIIIKRIYLLGKGMACLNMFTVPLWYTSHLIS